MYEAGSSDATIALLKVSRLGPVPNSWMRQQVVNFQTRFMDMEPRVLCHDRFSIRTNRGKQMRYETMTG